jgi:hypothetical protein
MSCEGESEKKREVKEWGVRKSFKEREINRKLHCGMSKYVHFQVGIKRK